MSEFRLKVCSTRHHVCEHMAFHQGNVTFEIQNQERPRISEGKAVRAEDESFQLMDSATGYIYSISQTAAVRPLGVAHVYDAFSIGHELDFRNDALRAFALPEAAIGIDLSVALPWANQILPAVGKAYSVPTEEDDNASVKKADDTDSDASQPSEGNDPTAVVDLITDEDVSDAESEEDFELSEKEQRFLQEAYEVYANTGERWLQQRAHSPPNCRTPFADAGNVQAVFEKFINLPDSWPLMRIMITLDGLSLQVERIITCVAAEVVAAHQYPDTQTKFVKRVAKKLTAILASYPSRHSGVQFSDIATSKSGPSMQCFAHFDFKMCFSLRRRAIFHVASQQLSPHPPL